MNPAYKKLVKNKLKFFRRIGLKNKNISIISNNCGGGFISQRFGLKYNSPTVGMFICTDDYLKFINDLEQYLSFSLRFIDPNTSKHYDLVKNTNQYGSYPVAQLNDIELFFMHYKSKEEAAEKWNKRKQRLDVHNMYVLLFENEFSNESLIRKFDGITVPHKTFVFENYASLSNGVYCPEVKESNDQRFTSSIIMKYVDWKNEFNSILGDGI